MSDDKRQSDTPRTDINSFQAFRADGGKEETVVRADDARQLERKLAEAKAENACDACAGTGMTASGIPCMCGGTGKMSNAARYLRDQLVDQTLSSATLRRIDQRYAGDDPSAEYAKHNPLGGPASVFRTMASRIEAGEEYYSVLEDYGFQVADRATPDRDKRQLGALVRALKENAAPQDDPPLLEEASLPAAPAVAAPSTWVELQLLEVPTESTPIVDSLLADKHNQSWVREHHARALERVLRRFAAAPVIASSEREQLQPTRSIGPVSQSSISNE